MKITRRQSLRQASLLPLAAATTTLGTPALAQSVRRLTMVTAWPRGLPGLGTTAQRFTDRVNQMSGGSLEIVLQAAGELVPAFEIFDAVEAGTADLYHGAAYYWQGKHPAYAFFTSVPFGPNPLEFQAWLHFGGGQEIFDEVGRQFGLKHLIVGDTGEQMSGWYREPIERVEDFQGLRIRFPGFAGQVLTRLGAVVVNLPASEVITALASGTLDGSDWVAPWPDRAMGLYRAAPYYYYPGYQEPSGMLDLGISLSVWESLSDSERAIIENAAQAETLVTLAEYQTRNAENLKVLVEEEGVKLQAWSDEILDRFLEVSREVVAETAESDALAAKVRDSLAEFLRTTSGWTRISKNAFLNARDERLLF